MDEHLNGRIYEGLRKWQYRRFNAAVGCFESLAYAGGAWPWKADPRYYDSVTRQDSTFGLEVPRLLRVCHFQPELIATDIVCGCSYQLSVI